ncbi:MAG: HAD-IA family hydrolase [Rhodothermales bacterium]|nr:HAD-IA family hydrolase [Rhodothermales bacterium]MBO6780489.1 HAD-IA family hydrolase [Rhodothermales bacterium]
MDSASRRVIEHAPLVLADFDGTIASLRTDWNDLKRRLAGLCGARDWPWDEGRGLDQNLRRVRSTHGEGAFLSLCRVVAEAEIAGFQGAAVSTELVTMLRDRAGEPTAIVTNNTKSGVQRILKHPIFAGLDVRVIGKEDVARSKPSPDGLIRACQLYVASPRATVFIGDADTDEQAAQLAGIGIFIRAPRPGHTTLRMAA